MAMAPVLSAAMAQGHVQQASALAYQMNGANAMRQAQHTNQLALQTRTFAPIAAQPAAAVAAPSAAMADPMSALNTFMPQLGVFPGLAGATGAGDLSGARLLRSAENSVPKTQ